MQRRFGKRRLSGSSLGDRQNVRDAVHEGPSGATERSREPPTSNAGREKESATRTTLNTWHVINPEGKCGQLRARSVETNPVLPTIEGCPLFSTPSQARPTKRTRTPDGDGVGRSPSESNRGLAREASHSRQTLHLRPIQPATFPVCVFVKKTTGRWTGLDKFTALLTDSLGFTTRTSLSDLSTLSEKPCPSQRTSRGPSAWNDEGEPSPARVRDKISRRA